ncbi:U-box domain-containing protein 33-like [Cajanus cajan]|uniref:U-box domain-containing protein 33-like n=1 Tax=Cajanus cajan TaxID=3821 RepID=UPI0010FBACFB|nr:U-box domain-containing protein 33-like [Cajanus cajan]
MEDVNRIPREAKDYYSSSIWLSENAQVFEDLKKSDLNRVNGIYVTAGKDSYGYDYQEIETPEISRTLTSEIVDYDLYSRQTLTSEIVEIIEDGSKSINNKDRRVDDLYVAVGKDDVDVVKWALDHAVSPGSRIFLIHVSSPITLIPTPVGKFERSQLTPQQVRLYVNEVNNKRKDLLQKYIQMSNEAKVVAETLLLESNDTGKAILDLTTILNITNLVMGIKKLPCTRRNNKLSKGVLVKKNAPKSCKVTLVYNGEVFVSKPYMDGLESCGLESQSKSHSKANIFQCMCFSGCVREDNGT